jgi:hypothetical protein
MSNSSSDQKGPTRILGRTAFLVLFGNFVVSFLSGFPWAFGYEATLAFWPQWGVLVIYAVLLFFVYKTGKANIFTFLPLFVLIGSLGALALSFVVPDSWVSLLINGVQFLFGWVFLYIQEKADNSFSAYSDM